MKLKELPPKKLNRSVFNKKRFYNWQLRPNVLKKSRRLLGSPRKPDLPPSKNRRDSMRRSVLQVNKPRKSASKRSGKPNRSLNVKDLLRSNVSRLKELPRNKKTLD